MPFTPDHRSLGGGGVELGLDTFGDVTVDAHGQPISQAETLRNVVAEGVLADQVGIDAFGVGEHHRPDFAVSAPEVVLAAIAGRTSRIVLGSAVTVLSSDEPVRVFQRFSTLNAISNGRAEVILGRGSFTESFPLFGYDLKDYDDLFDEKLKLLLKINNEEKITWKGKFRAPLNNQEVFHKTKNGKHPIWVAVGGTPESVVRSGSIGLPVIFAIIGGNPAQFKPLFEYYEKVWEHFKHPKETFQVGVHMHALFGENGQKTADEYYPLYSSQMNRVGKSRGWPPYQRQQFDLGRGPDGHLIVGDANEAIDKILAIHELFGLSRFSAHMDVGAPSHAALMKSIEIYGNKIAPKVREALKK